MDNKRQLIQIHKLFIELYKHIHENSEDEEIPDEVKQLLKEYEELGVNPEHAHKKTEKHEEATKLMSKIAGKMAEHNTMNELDEMTEHPQSVATLSNLANDNEF